ncbi:MAG: ABC transporter permease [Sphingobacteriales bacterium]|nr:MAG: ABC transporter permease [Sphingobacteriales bacterium]
MRADKRHSFWNRLLRKRGALLSLTIILFTVFVALFAYFLAPDNTPYGNRMIIELGARQPGFKKDVLLVPRNVRQSQPSFVAGWLAGRPSDYDHVPINGYWFSGDSMHVRHYIDEGLEDTLSYGLAALLRYKTVSRDPSDQRKLIEKEMVTSRQFILGTDRYGRDILSRLIIGSRVSISVGLVAVILSLTIGIVLGSFSGYFGGWVDNLVMWFINILWAIPTLLLVFAITLTIGKGFWEIFVAIGLTMWVGAARLIRGQVLVLREMDYVTVARALGLSDFRIIFRHILPNIAGPIMVIAAGNFATAILIEAGLSFLGIGVQPPMPSWGLMIKEHYNFLLTNRPMLAIIPGLAIMVLVYAFNVLGNALRDVLDVKS